jgi:U2 small nuclear ribonucleoprotein B''
MRACPTSIIRSRADSSLHTSADSSATGQPIANAPRRTIQMPDEYLPPNKVLFLQNLPEGTTKEDLQDVFEQ